MSDQILVTYASQTGSTAEVAAFMGQTLTENGFSVTVAPMQDVKDLSPYIGVIAGSAIQSSQWLPEAMTFLETHQTALQQKPFAAYLLCMTLAMKGNKYQEQVSGWMQPIRDIANPFSEGLFAGALHLDRIDNFWARFGFRLSVMMGVWKEGDHRDWEAIRAWTKELIPTFEAVRA